jgi:hypothetical protein
VPQRGIMLIEKSKQTFLVLQRSTIKMGSTLSLLWSAPEIVQFYSINILPPQLLLRRSYMLIENNKFNARRAPEEHNKNELYHIAPLERKFYSILDFY